MRRPQGLMRPPRLQREATLVAARVEGSEPAGAWQEVPSDRIDEAAAAALSSADGLLAIGGGSAIDLAKAVSAETGLPVVSLPTTYSGAEWTSFFGVRDPDRRLRGGGAGARLGGIVYEPQLTLDLPRRETVGTALNFSAGNAPSAAKLHGRYFLFTNPDPYRLARDFQEVC